MPKQSHGEASTRSIQRITHGADSDPKFRECARDINTLAQSFESRIKSQSTFAVGRVNRVLYYAKQGVVKQEFIDAIDPADYGCTRKQDCSLKGKIDDLALSGIHAEMMIIRYLVQVEGHSKGVLSGLGLEIATTKGCCLDCAGWLNEYRIPHTRTSGSASVYWRHPLTLSLYRHFGTVDDNVEYYQTVTLQRSTATRVEGRTHKEYKSTGL